ncbi:MAG: condensation domain-containing protein, partial [Ktedonobacteraceae bacterium]
AVFVKYLQAVSPQAIVGAGAIPRRSRGSSAPLSFKQQQLWLLAHLVPDTSMYTECVTIQLPDPLDVAALEHSLNEIIKHHEAWRTSFPTVDGQPVQVIHPFSPLALTVVDLRPLPASSRETEALCLAKKERHKDLSPLQRSGFQQPTVDWLEVLGYAAPAA